MTLLRPAEQAARLKVSRATLLRLTEEEGLPCVPLLIRAGKRRILRYDAEEVEKWIAGRRERQIRATLSGQRFARRNDAG